MYWENIHGAFTFHKLYSQVVNSYDNAKFVEIGAWKGKSAVYMAEQIKLSNKNIKFYVVDIFETYMNESIYPIYLKNIEPVKDYITTIRGDSAMVYTQFADESLDFIFIDADHSYESVTKDITYWYTKLKPGGIMAGHDYLQPTCGVKQAVDSYFKGKANIDGSQDCWIIYK